MLHRKLLEILGLLSQNDVQRLRLFLQSPYFNRSRNPQSILRLFEHIMAHDANPICAQLAKEYVFSLFFPEHKFEEKTKSPLDGLASDLFSIVKKFLAYSKFENNEFDFKEGLALLQFYRENDMEERFWQAENALRNLQHHDKIKGVNHHFNQFLLEEEVAHFKGLHNTFEDDANLLAKNQSLDMYYYIQKLDVLCSLKYQQIYYNFPFDHDDNILKYLETDNKFNVPIINLYKIVFELLNDITNESKLCEFSSLLDQYTDKINFDVLKDFNAYYRSFYIRKYYRAKSPHVGLELFKVYKNHFEKGYFYYNGKVLSGTFRSTIIFALKNEQFDWAKIVLDAHPPEKICGTRFPTEVHLLTQGDYFFYLKNYDEALNKLSIRPFENPNFGLVADVLAIKIYYETNNDILDYKIKSLDQKVRRTKISSFSKSRYYNFLKKLDKIVKYRFPKDVKKLTKLLEEIRTMPDILEREWLIEKTEQALAGRR